jgi:hypothetical protein
MNGKNPKIKVAHLDPQIDRAIKLIAKFQRINDLKINYTITLDYKLDCFGMFYPDEKHNITINPDQFHDTSKEEPHAVDYTTDFGLCSVVVHEIIHLLAEKYLIHDLYKEKFKNNKFILNNNSRKDVHETIAEEGRLYFMNPYFLKLISPDRFEFFQGLFQTPSPITKKSFIVKWKSWNPQIHQLCLEKWGIKVLGNRIFQDK